jgi:hypothetical protein
MALPLFDANGMLIERVGDSAYIVYGADVWDAGTEVNDEEPMTTAHIGQTMVNTGVTENGVIRSHAGFIGSYGLGGGPKGNILQLFPQADFTRPRVPLAMITIVKE